MTQTPSLPPLPLPRRRSNRLPAPRILNRVPLLWYGHMLAVCTVAATLVRISAVMDSPPYTVPVVDPYGRARWADESFWTGDDWT